MSVTKERPILFSAPMVRAILEGRKTQTRRVVKNRKCPDTGCDLSPGELAQQPVYVIERACPYGSIGDRLWVRETFSGPHCMEASEGCAAAPPSKWGRSSRIWYWADGNPSAGDWTRPRPSIHMPRWASRITLGITGVRVERLQDISEADAKAEGVNRLEWSWDDGESPTNDRDGFECLWVAINGRESWEANPWVWVIEFTRSTS